MKRKDLKPCIICGQGVANGNNLIFYEFSIKTHILDTNAVRQEHGLEQYFGGGMQGATLAAVMGTDPDLTTPAGKKNGLLCMGCLTTRSIGALIEAEYEDKKEG